MSATQSSAVRSSDEVADAIRGLSAPQWGRLRAAATAFARGRPIEAEDLLQEAFRRALDGSRSCPNHVDLAKFLAESMRSIAHGEKAKRGCRPPLVPLASHGDTSDEAVDLPTHKPTVEERMAYDQEGAAMQTAIIALFDDDPVAQVIVEGIFEDLQGEDLRELTELDATAYQTKRKLIRRRIDKHFPDGWKP